MTDLQLNRGIALAKAGRNLEARNVLGQVVRKDPQSVRAWLWLAGVVETEEQQRYCLERVLHLNPEDEICKQILIQMRVGTINGIPILDPAVQDRGNEITNRKKRTTADARPTSAQTPTQDPAPIAEHATLESASDNASAAQIGAADGRSSPVTGSSALSRCYFLGHPLTSDHAGDPEAVITNVFGRAGYEPHRADEHAGQGAGEGARLLDTCKHLFSTCFSVFDLSSGDPNGYLELGIALGLNCPVVAIANFKACLPPALEGQGVTIYADSSDLEAKLVALCDGGFPLATHPVPDYCAFCGRACDSMSTPPDENSYLVLHHSKLLWRNLMQSVTPRLAEYHLYPSYLSGRTSGATLCDVRRKVLASQFVLCHPGALSDQSSFLALGIAIGSRVPWVLLTKEGQDDIPPSLQGIDRIEYSTVSDLGELLIDTLGGFLGRVMSKSPTRNNGTALLSLPFWIQLEDWLSRATQPEQAPDLPRGDIQVAQYEGQAHLAQHAVPQQGLLFGRDPGCDVVVQNPSTSAHHFRILKGRTGRTFVEDLQSKNGTFLNGTRLPPGERVEIKVNDTIRIPGARFLIWDERPIPREQEAAQPLGSTAMLPPILRIEIPDVPPPTYVSTWDHLLTLTVFLPDGRHRTTFEVQAYYPIGRILSKLVDLLDLPRGKYQFKLEDKYVGDDETPLSLGLQTGNALTIAPAEVNPSGMPQGR